MFNRHLIVIGVIVAAAIGAVGLHRYGQAPAPVEERISHEEAVASPQPGNMDSDVSRQKNAKPPVVPASLMIDYDPEILAEGLPNDAELLPMQRVTPEAIQALFTPHYTEEVKQVLPDELHEALEEAVFNYVQWMFEPSRQVLTYHVASINAFWRDQALPDSFVVSEEQFADARDRRVAGSTLRVGFSDPPFIVSRKPLNQVVSDPRQSHAYQADPERFDEDLVVVQVRLVRKVVATVDGVPGVLYRPVEAWFALNPKNQIQSFLQIREVDHRPSLTPALEIPQFLRGEGSP